MYPLHNRPAPFRCRSILSPNTNYTPFSRIVWKLYFLGAASTVAGNAAECANEQGKFWEYHDWLYKNQPSESDTTMYVTDKLTTAAEGLGASSNQFKTCLDSTKFSKNVADDMSEGSTAGVTGTPSFVIGKLDSSGKKIVDGQLLVGAQPYSVFQSALDQALK